MCLISLLIPWQYRCLNSSVIFGGVALERRGLLFFHFKSVFELQMQKTKFKLTMEFIRRKDLRTRQDKTTRHKTNRGKRTPLMTAAFGINSRNVQSWSCLIPDSIVVLAESRCSSITLSFSLFKLFSVGEIHIYANVSAVAHQKAVRKCKPLPKYLLWWFVSSSHFGMICFSK